MTSINGSLSIEPPAEGSPAQTQDANRSAKRIRQAVQILLILVITLLVVTLVNSHAATFALGRGSIRGHILDQDNTPVSAKVYIESTGLEGATNADGYFEIRGIPIGSRVMLIAWMNAGYEAPVEVHRGGITDLGIIYVPTGARPDHDVPRLEWR